jgi:thiamine pyrophosphate-dependent acetolactate synthase large subunit-like protein
LGVAARLVASDATRRGRLRRHAALRRSSRDLRRHSGPLARSAEGPDGPAVRRWRDGRGSRTLPAMSEGLHGGQLTARQLRAAGIDTIFGVVAGPMIELFAGAQEAGLHVVGCRHEESAAFMASAWGWVRRQAGVCVVGSGPGMTNAVTPMHVATESAMPLVVLGGSTLGPMRGLGGFQEADQVAFARPGCKWTVQVDRTERIPELVHLALGKAASGRPGAVYVDYPGHWVGRRVAEERVRFRDGSPAVHAPHPDPDAIERVAEMLALAERPLLLVGKGAAWADAGPAIRGLVDRGIPYVTSPMGRGTVPDDHPHFANAARGTALREADAVLMLGGRFNWIFQFGSPARFAAGVRIAQVDLVAEELWSGAEVEIGVVADVAAAAAELARALEGRSLRSADGRWLARLRRQREENEAELARATDSDAVPIDPHRLAREVRDALPRDAVLAVDGETIMGIARQVVPSYTPRSRLNAGTTGCMGTGVPYALGAKLARPEAPVVAVLGDYAFGAAAMEIETAARVGANVVFVVADNEGIAGHAIQDGMLPPGSPRIASLLPAHYEKMAEMVDGHAERVERPEEIRPALERALAADRVSLVHVRVDPKARRLSGGVYLR